MVNYVLACFRPTICLIAYISIKIFYEGNLATYIDEYDGAYNCCSTRYCLLFIGDWLQLLCDNDMF